MNNIERAILSAIEDTAHTGAASSLPVAMVVGYENVLGTAVRKVGQITISTDGNPVFYVGSDTTTYTLDTLIGSGGIIDVSQAKWNTIGEVDDEINAGTDDHGWKSFPLDALRADSANNTLKTASVNDGNLQINGEDLVYDVLTSSVFSAICLTRNVGRPRKFTGGCRRAKDFSGIRPFLKEIRSTIDFATGAIVVQLWERDGTTETLLQEIAGGADATEQDLDFSANGQYQAGFWGAKGTELIIRARAKSTFANMSAGTLETRARLVPWRF